MSIEKARLSSLDSSKFWPVNFEDLRGTELILIVSYLKLSLKPCGYPAELYRTEMKKIAIRTAVLFAIALFGAPIFLNHQPQGAEPPRPFIRTFIEENEKTIGESRQLIFATHKDPSSFSIRIELVEKRGSAWKPIGQARTGTIGKNGFAPLNQKKEGDGKSPTGVFRLGPAFGYGASVLTRMPYRQATEKDVWVDDPDSEDYNRWVTGVPKATSFEKMKREDDLYKYGIVIEYNMNPIVKGKGSAIFLHLWRDQSQATSGCVAMAEGNVLKLLRWLNPAEKPLIIMGTEDELRRMKIP